MHKYRTAPLATPSLPTGIPYIIVNEAAERFSYYGMRAILVIFMTQYLHNAAGDLDLMSDEEARGYFHLFTSAAYFTPVLGALLADGLLGKYRTIIYLSLLYCLGHAALAADDSRLGLLIGQALIALGAGGIKPCVSAHLGDQFGHLNRHLLSQVYGWFYFAINLGAFASMLITPWLLQHYGSSYAFALPGILMLMATLTFWAGRHKFAHIPPAGTQFIKATFGQVGLSTMAKLSVIFLFVSMFWALFDQTGSAWVLQAEHMNRMVFGYEVLPSQLQALNPLLIMLLIPVFSYAIYPCCNRFFQLTALRKMVIGMFLTAVAFAVPASIQELIDAGQNPHIVWQMLAYLVLTSAEVMVSITCLEFAYTQAPTTMKSFIMAFYLLSVAVGNLFTGAVNFMIEGSEHFTGASYYWLFTCLMLTTALLFVFVVRNYREKTYIHAEQL